MAMAISNQLIFYTSYIWLKSQEICLLFLVKSRFNQLFILNYRIRKFAGIRGFFVQHSRGFFVSVGTIRSALAIESS